VDGDWPGRLLRPLPRTVTPAHDETVLSYLGRLASVNRLDTDALRIHVSGDERKSAPVRLDALATVSGQPEHVLRTAILQLGAPHDVGSVHTLGRSVPGIEARIRCRHCTLARGHRGDVWCWHLHENLVCLRHRRWISHPNGRPEFGQPDLTHQPEILQSNRRHRRLIRRHGRHTVLTAFREASHICHRWHDRHEHDADFLRLMDGFHGQEWRVSTGHPTVDAARYPQIVALTRLLASPSWRARARQTWPEPVEFLDELRRTVAPNYRWTLAHPYGAHDPLAELIIADRRHYADPTGGYKLPVKPEAMPGTAAKASRPRQPRESGRL
jgi:hypothetical protein